MRYRALAKSGDMQFGRSGLYLVDSPAAVAQAVKTRLNLMSGEWFLNLSEGTPYGTEILGTLTQGTRDAAIKSRILETPGVQEIVDYSSSVTNRVMTVSVTVSTQYGLATVEQAF